MDQLFASGSRGIYAIAITTRCGALAIAIRSGLLIVARRMKTLCAFAACVIVLACSQIFAGTEQTRTEATTEELNPQRFESAVESGLLFGEFNPTSDYDVGAEFIIARGPRGVHGRDSWT